jgi:ribosome-associated protein
VRETVKKQGMDVLRTEGEENGEWIIVDCGAAVAHIMQPGIRDYYHLEEIWGGKAVRMKVGAVNTGLVKASEPEPAPRRGAPAKKAAAEDAVKPRKAPARKAAAKSFDKPAPKTTARKAADKSAAYQRVAGKSPARKGAAAKKAPARKTPTRKALRTT